MVKLTLSVTKLSGDKKAEFDKMKKKARVNERLDHIHKLESIFPECFNVRKPKPLKLGIEDDILKRLPEDFPISKKKLCRALKYYVMNIKYKTTLLRNPLRFDLDGNPSGPVELEHKEDAKRWLQDVKKLKKNKGNSASRRRSPSDTSL